MTEFERINLYLDEVKRQNMRATREIMSENGEPEDARCVIFSTYYVEKGLKKIYENYPELDNGLGAEIGSGEEERIRFENLAWLANEGMKAQNKGKSDVATKIYKELLEKAGDGYFKLAAQAGLYSCESGEQTPQEPLEHTEIYINRSLAYLCESIYVLESMMREQNEQTMLYDEIKKEFATAAFYELEAKRKLGLDGFVDDLTQEIKDKFERSFNDLKKAVELESAGKTDDARKIYAQILTSNLAYFTLRAQAGLYRCGGKFEA